MELNPVFGREMQVRWRARPAFFLMLAYAGVLAVALVWRYQDTLSRADLPQVGGQLFSNSPMVLARLGHELFAQLTWMQALVWMLIAPVLTATTLATERERGLLEALQLSALSPRRILGGKLMAVAAFIGLMLLVPLPIAATCLLLGGVSPGEVLLALLLHAVTALTCAVIGLFCSARSHHAAGALRSAFTWIVVWGIGSFAAALLLRSGMPWQWRWVFFLFDWMPRELLNLAGLTNPVLAAGTIVGMHSSVNSIAAPAVFYIFNLTFQCILIAVLLRKSAQALSRPLPQPRWVDRRHWTAWLRARLLPEEQGMEGPRNNRAPLNLSRGVRTSLLWEFPVAAYIRFANPILQREVRAKFRLRSGSLSTTLTRGALGVGAGGIFVFLTFCALDPMARRDSWEMLTSGGLIAIVLAVAVMGAGAFTREREFGAWDGLRLSLLSPRQVLAGKLLAPLITCAYYSAPLWPIMLLCLVPAPATPSARSGSIGIEQVIASLLIVAATAFCAASCALLFSWLCRRTAAAVTWTLATLFLTLVFVPMFAGWFNTGASGPLGWIHPWSALQMLTRESWTQRMAALQPWQSPAEALSSSAPLLIGFVNATFMLSLGGILLLITLRCMNGALREKDPERRVRPDQTQRRPFVITIH